MILHKKSHSKIDNILKVISKILSNRENSWNENQNEKMLQRVQMKIAKGKKAKDYCKKLLQDCKTWCGPCASAEELHIVIREHFEKETFIVKTEMAYYVHTHKAEKVLQPELFILNGIIHSEKLENLLIILEGEDASSSLTVANLPTSAEVVAAMPQNMATEAIDKLNDRT